MRKRLMLGFLALSSLASARTDNVEMKAGLWEETGFIAMFDVSGDKPVPVAPGETATETNCYSEQDMRQNALLLGGAQGACTISNLQMQSGRLALHVACDIDGATVFEGEFAGTYDATNLHLAGTPRATVSGKRMELRMRWD